MLGDQRCSRLLVPRKSRRHRLPSPCCLHSFQYSPYWSSGKSRMNHGTLCSLLVFEATRSTTLGKKEARLERNHCAPLRWVAVLTKERQRPCRPSCSGYSNTLALTASSCRNAMIHSIRPLLTSSQESTSSRHSLLSSSFICIFDFHHLLKTRILFPPTPQKTGDLETGYSSPVSKRPERRLPQSTF